jgi:isopenicillin N synthase-like dioxygenase
MVVFKIDVKISRAIIEEYIEEMEKLAFKLLELIALSLGVEAKRFEEFFKDQTSFIRFNHYPPCPSPHLALGVGRHKDAGALTILAQDDVGGLEVKRKTDQEWVPVKPTQDAYIINVCDIIQVLLTQLIHCFFNPLIRCEPYRNANGVAL